MPIMSPMLATRAVFERYHIVSPAELVDAAQKLAGTKRHKTAQREP